MVWKGVKMGALAMVMLQLAIRGECRLNWRAAQVPEAYVESGRSRGTFAIKNDQFVKNGTPIQLLAGSVHYFRIHPQYWSDRLLRVRALGLNTVQTFIPWSIHEPQPGAFDFTGAQDLAAFVKLAQEVGLNVMLRLGPYACGEVEFGGFPAWLLTKGPMSLRTSDPKFLAETDAWWAKLLPQVKPLLIQNGGPVIMVQVENEYGWYGSDHVYLQHLVDTVRAALGPEIIIYTTDTAFRSALEGGTLKGDAVYTAVDFNLYTDPEEAFALQREYNPPGMSPPFSAEYYTGWHTRWGEPLSHSASSVVLQGLKKLLQVNASVSLYVAHGGTNFGFSNGANTFSEPDYRPVITSYDYGAPISEAGDLDLNNKFRAIRTLLESHLDTSLPDPPARIKKAAFDPLPLHQHALLLDNVAALSSQPEGISSEAIKPMEFFNQSYGFILYTTTLPEHTAAGNTLSLVKVHDRAQVYIEVASGAWVYVGTVGRWLPQLLTLPPEAAVPGARLQILVENMGRTSFGDLMWDQKGITDAVYLQGQALSNWTIYPLPLTDISHLEYQGGDPKHPATSSFKGQRSMLQQPTKKGSTVGSLRTNTSLQEGADLHMRQGQLGPLPVYDQSNAGGTAAGPTFFRAWLELDSMSLADTYLSTKAWGKGVAFINGFNLGHYWPTAGPQCTLYIPAPLLKEGTNELVLLELDSFPAEPIVSFASEPDYSCPSHKLQPLQQAE